MEQKVIEIAAAGFLHNISKFATEGNVLNLNLTPEDNAIIKEADKISAGSTSQEQSQNYLISIFDELDGEVINYQNRRYQYTLGELSPENVFPKSKKNTPADKNTIVKDFKTDFKKTGNLEERLKSLDETGKKWFTFVPSAVMPDISLYDHARTTSALAQALYVYHKSNNDTKIGSPKDNEKKKFLYFKAKFNGIQNFIFSTGSQTNKKAAKILRGRSFYISLLMKRTAALLCENLGITNMAIVMNAAGSITAILPNTDKTKNSIETVKQTINDWLIEKFYGEVTVSFAYVEVSAQDVVSNLETVSAQIIKKLDEAKYTKLPLNKLQVVDNYFKEGETPCPYCGKRPSKAESCDICQDLINIGENIINKTEIPNLKVPIFGKYTTVYKDDYDNLYVPHENYITKDFDKIAEQSKGIEVLGVLKADVDNLGALFRQVAERGGLSRQATLSRLLDAFWTMWLPNELATKEKYKNIYTVFAGGDDLFLIGPWDIIIDFALHLRDKFTEFSCGNKNFSAGIAFLKSGEPIDTFYRLSEEALEKSKHYRKAGNNNDDAPADKNALTLFGETISWESKETLNGCYQDIEKLIEEGKLNSGALYKLMSFIDMAKTAEEITSGGKKVPYKDMQPLKWKALLTYFISRNKEIKELKDKQEIIEYFIQRIEDKNQRSILKAMLWRNIYENRERRQ